MARKKRIHVETDAWGAIEVFDRGDERFLSFGDGDEQSCIVSATPHTPPLDYIRAMLLPLLYGRPKDALLLGLGAGSLATALHRAYKSMTLRAVELRPAVIDVAQRFFSLPQSPRLELIAADACDYLLQLAAQTEPRATDLILCDLYNADGMEPRTFDADFIEACGKLLGDKGWLVINCWDEHREDSDIFRHLSDHFAEIYTCTVSTGNWLLFASRKQNKFSQKQLLERCAKVSEKLEYNLGEYLALMYEIYRGPEPFDIAPNDAECASS